MLRGAWQATVYKVTRVGLDLVTKHNNTYLFIEIDKPILKMYVRHSKNLE